MHLHQKISAACNIYFNEEVLSRKFYKDYTVIGLLLYELTELDVLRPSESVLKVILKCCDETLENNENKQIINNYVNHLSRLMSAFTKWNFNPDEYREKFCNKLFREVRDNLSKMDSSKPFTIKLKPCTLKDILLVVLTFDKENDFELIKDYWRSEMLSVINDDIVKPAADEILAVARRCGKQGQHLEQLMSTTIYDKFLEIIN